MHWNSLTIFSPYPVYEPSDDSFLLASAVQIPPLACVLDLGCGSGIQGLNAALQGASKIVFADQNPAALQTAEQNVSANAHAFSKKPVFSFVQSDLFSALDKKQKFDCIVFNPPYVASDSKKWVEVDGGKQGREILDLFLAFVSDFVKPKGTVFFLQSSLNGIGKTRKKLERFFFRFEIVARQKLFFEELVVFKAQKK